jgi:hypothetical protein
VHLDQLQGLHCGTNPAIGAVGWAALAETLPHLRALRDIYASECASMGCAGARAIAAVLPRCAPIELLTLESNGIGDEGKAALRRGWAPLRLAQGLHPNDGLFLETPIDD